LKKFILPIALTASLLLPSVAFGAGTYKVVSGDTLWKVAVKNQVGITELISANSQVKNINMIYPGQSLNIPSNHYQSIEQQVVNLVNAERAKAGLKPLKADWELARVARFKSEDMRDNRYFDHNSPIYGTPFQMMKSFGINYRSAGENIAAGQTTAESVMKSWMNSPGHKKNILSPSFTHIGVGYAKGGSYGHYWTQQFMSK
jgi:uncharacterized YkwD family protein/spore coat assembly protein SafA